MPKPVKGILFDKDGTLFDFSKSWTNWISDLLLQLARGDRSFAAKAGANLGFDFESGKFEPDCFIVYASMSQISARLRAEFPSWPGQSIFEVVLKTSSEAVQVEATPLRPLLRRFKSAGYQLGIATNDSESIARSHLDSAGVLEFFEFIVGWDSGYGEKPDPGMLLAFCEATGIPPEEAIFVGDSLTDLQAGRNAGMTVVGVLTGLAERTDLSPFAETVLENVSELPAWISEFGQQSSGRFAASEKLR